jgi:tetratricopeptide (TPR) repeat protein
MTDINGNIILQCIADAEKEVECENFSEALKIYNHGLEIAKKGGDTKSEYLISCGISDTYHKMGEFENVVEQCRKAIQKQLKTEDFDFAARNISQLGYALLRTGKAKLAEQNINESLSMLKNIPDPYIVCDICFFTSLYYHELDDLEKSLVFAKDNLHVAKAANLTSKLFAIYELILSLHSEMGNHKEALDFAFHQLKFAKDHRSEYLKSLAQLNIARLYLDMDKEDKAIDYFDKAFKSFVNQEMYDAAFGIVDFIMDELVEDEERKMWHDTAQLKEMLSVAHPDIAAQALFPCWASCLIIVGAFKKAEDWLEETLEIMDKHRVDAFSKGPVLFQLAMVSVEQNKFKKAVDTFKKALISLDNDQESELLKASIHGQLGMLYAAMDKEEDAKAEYEKAIEFGKKWDVPGLEALQEQYNSLLENKNPGLFD